MTPYSVEREMYPEVQSWLRNLLHRIYGNAIVADTSQQRLSQVIHRLGLGEKLSSDWGTWDIKVDILGVVSKGEQSRLVFVECKIAPITLQHLCQLLGYCRVAEPEYAYIVSPRGMARSLERLLKIFRREDILTYGSSPQNISKRICIVRWNPYAKLPDPASVFPSGYPI